MSMLGQFIGTVKDSFQIYIGGVKLKNNSGGLKVTDKNDANSTVTASKFKATEDEIELNDDAAGSGADFKMQIKRPATGMTAAVAFTLPATAGSPNQVVQTDGAGNLSWGTPATSTQNISTDSTNLVFGSASTVAMFTLPVGAVVQKVRVIVDTAFNGTPSISIGIAGTLAKYMPATDIDLTAAAKTIFEAYPAEAPVSGTPEDVIATYAAGSASAGAARMEVDYSIPT